MGKEKGAGFKFMARKGLIMLFFLSLGFISVEAGYGAESTFNVEEIVVTATRIPEPKSEVSSFVQVLSEERLSLSPSQDLGSFITQAGIGHIHRYPGFLTGRVAIRGLASDLFDQQKSRLLLLSDGVKIGTINFAKIPLQDVERVEIVKGPASVLYGSQAMGGVINVITKRAKKEGFYGEIGATCGSWDFYQGSVELMGKKDKVDFYFSSFRAAQNDY
ncbi:MAG: TonB-dependent receptor, partial [Caldimicrobium sp.]